METLKALFNEFRQAPLPALQRWESLRMPWFIMSMAALVMILTAMGYFQWYLELDPCELCVYIRFSQFCILFGGLIIMIKPTNVVLKLIGLALAWYGIIQGMMWSIELEQLHIAGQAMEAALMDGGDLFAMGGGAASCGTDPQFPLGLPLDEWFPYEFKPTGICGEDGWLMFGLNMAEYCIISYALYGIALAAGTLATMKNIMESSSTD